MNKTKFIEQWVKLGNCLKNNYLESNNQLLQAEKENPWFTQENIGFAISEIANLLTHSKLTTWLNNYDIKYNKNPKTIGLILSGNIPLVGFHDLLCVLISGNNALVKLSHKDKVLYQIIYDLLIKIDPTYSQRIVFTDKILENIDAIIATGSNNTSRYFDYYFGKYPHIIRKNRNSIAILNNDSKATDFEQVALDMFLYFGLGCRNVSFLLLPNNFNFNLFFDAIGKYKNIVNHNKYANNYLYQKTILAMNNINFYDNGFCLFTQNDMLSSPIGVVHYKIYNNNTDIEQFVNINKNNIQCVVSNTPMPFDTYKLGMSQKPELNDYADNVDTLNFLLGI